MTQGDDAMPEEQICEEESSEKKVQDVSQLPGVGAATIEKLDKAGYSDLLSISVASPGEIVGATEMSEATAKKVIAIARSNLEMEFTGGDELMRRRERVVRIGTGSNALNELFGGGMETGGITECFGKYGSGKSQIAHALATRCQLSSEKGGADGMAVFIDTEGTFRPERIVSIAKAAGLDPDQALAGIKVARAFNSDHQMLLAEKVEDLIKKRGLPIRVLIVDSLTAHFRAEYVGRGTLAERQQKLNRHMHTLAKLAEKYNLCVYVTNQVLAKPDMFFGDPTEAVGGNIVGHSSTYRVYLRRGKKGTRVAKMIDSPCSPESEAIFLIAEAGITDAK